jgi:hypothetical protein
MDKENVRYRYIDIYSEILSNFRTEENLIICLKMCKLEDTMMRTISQSWKDK